jgi:hypothetical protein
MLSSSYSSLEADAASGMMPGSVGGQGLLQPFPTDMEVDVEDPLILDQHNAPVEKTDVDFFNGEPAPPQLWCTAPLPT